MEEDSIYSIEKVPGKGLAVIALKDIPASVPVMISLPDIAVLYTENCKKYCSNCFKPREFFLGNTKFFLKSELISSTFTADKPFICENCDCFILCQQCNVYTNLSNYHKYECDAFINIPSELRKGNTDYLRFVLRMFNIMINGRPSLSSEINVNNVCIERSGPKYNFEGLCTRKELQSSETISRWTNFAKLFEKYISFPKEMTVEKLCDLFLRINLNSLGYPFKDEETLGWSLHSKASAFNHSCSPNCFILGSDGTVTVKTIAHVQKDPDKDKYKVHS